MATYPYPPQRQSPGWAHYWPWLIILASLSYLSWHYWPRHKSDLSDSVTLEPRTIAPQKNLLPEEIANIKVYEDAKDSVVYITSYAVRRTGFSRNLQEIPEGTGSGFIWDQRGFIVTNYHVIQNADSAEVTLDDHSTWKARLWGVAPDQDLAVLRIDAPTDKLKPIPVGASKDLKVGQKVWAIGNPFGLDQSLSTGVISAVGREIKSATGRPISGVIQTDASINPGNSGGPLIDSSGRLIGVNTAIYSPSGASAGVGFAIPVDTVNRVVTQLVNEKKIVRPGLGIRLAPDQESRDLGVKGVMVRGVMRNGAAARAGLQAGDVIVALDDKPLTAADDLFARLARHQVGDNIKVTVLRDDERQSFEVTLEGI